MVDATTKRFEELQYLRAIAAIMVVVFHTGGTFGNPNYFGATNLKFYTQGLDAGVDLFFVISGFVISLSLFKTSQNKSISRFLFNRVLRIYPLAILTALIFYTSNVVVLGKGLFENLPNLITSALLIPSYDTPVPSVIWTLKQELLFYVMFSLTFLHKKMGLILLVVWGLVSFLYSPEDEVLRILFHEKNVQFLFGLLACAMVFKFNPSIVVSRLIFIFAAIAFGYICYIYKIGNMNEQIASLYFAIAGLLIVFSSTGLKIPFLKIPYYLGEMSFSIYLIHVFFVVLLAKIAARFASDVDHTLLFVIVVSAATFAGVIYYFVFERTFETVRKKRDRMYFSRPKSEPA